jgi:hypothetical protein
MKPAKPGRLSLLLKGKGTGELTRIEFIGEDQARNPLNELNLRPFMGLCAILTAFCDRVDIWTRAHGQHKISPLSGDNANLTMPAGTRLAPARAEESERL